MDTLGYFRSISSELNALKDRMQYFVRDQHWLTVGEGKELILRTMLRRHLPGSVQVGRGFVIDDGWRSTQIDILLYDNTKPVLYRDGDLVFVTPDAVRGIIEVKAAVTYGRYHAPTPDATSDDNESNALAVVLHKLAGA